MLTVSMLSCKNKKKLYKLKTTSNLCEFKMSMGYFYLLEVFCIVNKVPLPCLSEWKYVTSQIRNGSWHLQLQRIMSHSLTFFFSFVCKFCQFFRVAYVKDAKYSLHLILLNLSEALCNRNDGKTPRNINTNAGRNTRLCWMRALLACTVQNTVSMMAK